MTPLQIRLVQRSFVKIEPIATKVGSKFYGRLFKMAPETRALFRGDMSYQHAKFMSVVAELVNLHLRSLISLPVTRLDAGEAAMPGMRDLGRRHGDFGVRPEHFQLMRTALMDTLAEMLDEDFTDEIREAWEGAFDVLSNVMKGGMMGKSSSAAHFLDRVAAV
jgi:hemoglobin-like flavoprotein